MKNLGGLLLLLLLASACPSPPVSPADAGPAYPQAPAVPAEAIEAVLPKDANGKPILLEVGGVPLTLGAPRKDAIGAAGKCRDLLTSCMTVSGDIDACNANVPLCKTATPWEGEEPCCAKACVVAYQEERRLGATVLEADAAVFGSTHECFPGLQELYRSFGGTPRRMPRRAP